MYKTTLKNIYISSLALRGSSPEEMIERAINNNWALEFSSGMPYRADMENLYMKAAIKRMPHNYFPAPETDFVLNLASINDEIRKKSIEHCKKGLYLAKHSLAPFFSAHSGFCIDPDPNELGKKIQFSAGFNKEKNKELFIGSVKEILKTADELEIDFLAENNVIGAFNLTDNAINPLLCCNAEEIKWLFDTIKHIRFGLLLDTAHLKVTCNTLHIDIDKEFNILKPFIKGIHHSDNDGFTDDNQPMKKDYWFLPYLKQYADSVHVIEVKDIADDIINNQIKLLQPNGC